MFILTGEGFILSTLLNIETLERFDDTVEWNLVLLGYSLSIKTPGIPA